MADAVQVPGGPKPQPLSPHLGIYRRGIHMMMSILHRMTGSALYFGTALLAWWLIAAAMGPAPFETVNRLAGSPVGIVVLAGYSWALIHHMLGGIRHFIWDTGSGFGLGMVRFMSWMTIVGSLLLTAAVWAVTLLLRGHFS